MQRRRLRRARVADAFVGTRLPLDLARHGIETIVLTGIHLDGCIEGDARAARDDACACQSPKMKPPASDDFFAPVISEDTFVRLVSTGTEHAQR